MKVERVSYDVITPSAARGILEAIHWKPAIRWVVDGIHVLRPVRFETIRVNEVKSKISERNVLAAMKTGSTAGLGLDVAEDRTQRASTILRDVEYVIEAHFEMTRRAGPNDTPGKHAEMFRRRASSGQCFHAPCLGVREFAADFELVEEGEFEAHPDMKGERDLGYMLHDIDFENGAQPVFYRAVMRDGFIDVASLIARAGTR